MRIYATADIHGAANRLRQMQRNVSVYRPDILAAAGDITGFFHPAGAVARLDTLGIPVLGIRGNSDLKRVDRLLDAGCETVSLHLRRIVIQGIPFVGIGGTIPVPFRSRICLSESALLEKVGALMDRNTVLIVHTPPWGARDEAGGKFHTGSRGLLEFIQKHQPRLVICGHIHERAGVAHIGETLVINCAMSRTSTGAIVDISAGRESLEIRMPGWEESR